MSALGPDVLKGLDRAELSGMVKMSRCYGWHCVVASCRVTMRSADGVILWQGRGLTGEGRGLCVQVYLAWCVCMLVPAWVHGHGGREWQS